MSNADEHIRLVKAQLRYFPKIENSHNAFNFMAFPDTYDENGNLRDKFKKQIKLRNQLKDKRSKI